MTIDPVTLEVFNHRFAAIAEEMGGVLCRSAFSPNIKERRDFSCAVFDAAGELVAQAAHIPVHLGSAGLSVQAAMRAVRMRRGDVVVLNDPFSGGTHLPDVTLVAPVFVGSGRRAVAYVANRAHHADIGGAAPGSLPLATEVYQEGLRLPPVRLVAAGRMVGEVVTLFLANTRVAEERRGDLLAQLAALRLGAERVAELMQTAGTKLTIAAMAALQAYSERLLRAELRRLPRGAFRAVDWMDDDGLLARRIPLRVALRLAGERAVVDFSGTAAQVPGGINANRAVTLAAVLYSFQALAGGRIPANAGLQRPLQIITPPGTLVNAVFPAAVAGGNVETSQRIVDVVWRALAQAASDLVPAASNGSMNNCALGGYDAVRQRHFAYYETVGGGAGGGPQGPGLGGVHTHMTNTLNTPVEVLEAAYPLRVTRYGFRPRSGGRGLHAGGDGIVREIEFLAPATVTLLTERRQIPPYGLRGGKPGRTGLNLLRRAGRVRRLPGKTTLAVGPGDRITLLTPGGGGWGRRGQRNAGPTSPLLRDERTTPHPGAVARRQRRRRA
ncbi:hydantoinase B/oxoprolinase family protein [Candidatus Binatia bacterium]|nr:hydantoinase B/oxoprolinase family protein [Candidatus Binatia bacterium]